jgi:hypothetical protein
MSVSQLVLIHDGFTAEGKYPAGKHGLGAVEFAYRPALAEDVYAFQKQAKPTGAAHCQAICNVLLKHLISWTVKSRGGEVAPLSLDNLKRLPYPILEHLIDTVFGVGPDAPVDLVDDLKN